MAFGTQASGQGGDKPLWYLEHMLCLTKRGGHDVIAAGFFPLENQGFNVNYTFISFQENPEIWS